MSSSTVKTETWDLSASAALSPADTSLPRVAGYAAPHPQNLKGTLEGEDRATSQQGGRGPPGRPQLAPHPGSHAVPFQPGQGDAPGKTGSDSYGKLGIIKLPVRVCNLASKVKKNTQNPQLLKVINNYFGTSGRPWAGTAPGPRVQR